jgi:hypothetical protein
MKRRFGGAITTTCLTALGVEMAACLGAGWVTSAHQVALEPVLSAAEVVALRFPDELLMEDAPAGPPADAAVADMPAAGDAAKIAEEQILMPSDRVASVSSRNEEASLFFSPSVTYPAGIVAAAPPETAPRTPPTVAPTAAPTRVASATSKSAPRRVNVRPGAVLSDAQIAGIKQRLKLTPDQEQMWPAVEVALRSLTYDKKSGTYRDSEGSRVAAIDASSPEVQNLNSAAYPLVMSFSDDQKREMNALARVNGLDELVPKF